MSNIVLRFLILLLSLVNVSGLLTAQQLHTAPNAKKIAKKLLNSKLRWAKGVVPYIIEDGVVDRENIVPAIEEWNSKTIIQCVPRRRQRSYVAFVSVDGGNCRAARGRVGGRQEIFIPPSGCSVNTLIHEIGHAVGLAHEHERYDRDAYISLRPENLAAESEAHTNNIDPLGPYDYASIMHYDPYSSTRNGHSVFETIPPGIPVRSAGLSSGDINKIAWMYGKPPDKVTISTNPPGLELLVDGEHVQAPRAFEWKDGSFHVLEAVSPQYRGDKRYLFGRWTTGGLRKHRVRIDPTGRWIQASFIEQRSTAISEEVPDGYLTIRSESEESWRAANYIQSESTSTDLQGQPIPSNGSHSFALPPTHYVYRPHFGTEGYRIAVPSDATELKITVQASSQIGLYARHRFPVIMRYEGKGVLPSIITDASANSLDTTETLVFNRSSDPPIQPGTYHIGLIVYGPTNRVTGRIQTTVTRGAGSTLTVRPQALTVVTSFGRQPLEQEITLSHAGCGPVRYEIKPSDSWLEVNPKQWTPQDEDRIEAVVSVINPSLSIGDRTASVVIEKERTNPRCEGYGKTVVPVHYVVTPRKSRTGKIQLRESAPTSVIRIENNEPFENRR